MGSVRNILELYPWNAAGNHYQQKNYKDQRLLEILLHAFRSSSPVRILTSYEKYVKREWPDQCYAAECRDHQQPAAVSV